MYTRKLSLTGMFAALIFVLTMFIKIPAPSGYIHLGDALIYTGAVLLGAPYILIAGAVGSALADIVGGYAMYAPATAVIKCLVCVPFLLVKTDCKKILNKKSVIMALPSGVITVSGYYFADLIIDKSYALVDLPGNCIQAAASAIAFIIIAAALDRAKIIDKIGL